MPTSPWTPPFTRFFFAQSLSWLGSSMTPVALSFGILRRTGDVESLSLVLVANTAPMILFLLLGGVIADRLPRGRLLVVTHVAAALTQAGSAAWFFVAESPLPVLLMLTALNGLSAAFTGPALRGVLAQLVPEQALERANAARATSRSAFRLVGPGVAGVIVGAADAGWALAVDAACLGGAALLLAGLRLGGSAVAGGGVLGDLHEGWREFAARSWLWSVTLAFCGVNVLIGAIWLVIGPLVAEQSIGPAGWGVVLGVRAAGQLAGGLLAYRWSPTRPLVAAQLFSVPYAAAFVALALQTGLLPLAIAAAAAGAGEAIAGVLWESTLQREIRPEALGRVASIDMLGSFASVPVGQLAAPVLLVVFGLRPTVLGGAVLLVAMVMAPLLVPSVRSLRR